MKEEDTIFKQVSIFFLYFISYISIYTNYLSFICRYRCWTRAGVNIFILSHVFVYKTYLQVRSMHEIWPFPAPQAKIYGVCGRWCWYQNHAPFPAYSVNFRLRRHKWGEVGRFGPPLARAKKWSLLFLLRCLSTLLPWRWSTPPAATALVSRHRGQGTSQPP